MDLSKHERASGAESQGPLQNAKAFMYSIPGDPFEK
jgi:hypothetical protein